MEIVRNRTDDRSLVMYLNWRELLFVIAHNGQEIESKEFVEKDVLFDGGWTCHFAAVDLTSKTLSVLPDIFARCDMPISENYLKYALGYQESVDEKFVNLMEQMAQTATYTQAVS